MNYLIGTPYVPFGSKLISLVLMVQTNTQIDKIRDLITEFWVFDLHKTSNLQIILKRNTGRQSVVNSVKLIERHIRYYGLLPQFEFNFMLIISLRSQSLLNSEGQPLVEKEILIHFCFNCGNYLFINPIFWPWQTIPFISQAAIAAHCRCGYDQYGSAMPYYELLEWRGEHEYTALLDEV
jgi:hypothetical protein